MKNTSKIAVAVVLLVLLVGMLLLTGLLGGKPELTVSVDSPVGIGYTTIIVESTGELEGMSITVGVEPAELVSTEGNSHVYQYFVSPYSARDPLGVQTVKASGIDSSGRTVEATAELNISYFAVGDNFLGVTHYYLTSPPNKEEQFVEYLQPFEVEKSIAFGTGSISFLFEMDEGKTSRNTEIINSFQSLIVELTSSGVNVSSYAVDVRDGNWITCIDTDSENVPLAECKRMVEEGPSILLKLPDYPTTQVEIRGKTIELQPTQGQVKLVVESTIAALRAEAPWVPHTGD